MPMGGDRILTLRYALLLPDGYDASNQIELVVESVNSDQIRDGTTNEIVLYPRPGCRWCI